MSYIKTFENFSSSVPVGIYIANPEAESILLNDVVFESLNNEGFYQGEGLDEAIKILENSGFSSPADFAVFSSLDEAFNVKYQGHRTTPKGVEILVDINGHKYGYSQKEGDLDIRDVARKFEKILQFSARRALNWLKKHTILTSGSKSTEAKNAASVKEGKKVDLEEVVVDTDSSAEVPAESTKTDLENVRHYMFFQNLKTIKSHIDMIMSLDQSAIDSLLDSGHDWAADHISTSKDNIEEVCGWLYANLK